MAEQRARHLCIVVVKPIILRLRWGQAKRGLAPALANLYQIVQGFIAQGQGENNYTSKKLKKLSADPTGKQSLKSTPWRLQEQTRGFIVPTCALEGAPTPP